MRQLPVAFAWMTVLPVPPRLHRVEVDRASAGRVIAWVPAVGVVVGALAGALAWIATTAGLPELACGTAAVAGAALLTRGMHLDGFADCVDALGSYGPPERARAIMRQGTVGPFGVAALVLALLAQSAAAGALAGRGEWAALIVAFAASRVAAVIGCRRGWQSANPDGFGALTAGTQGLLVQVAWAALAAAAAVWANAGHPWQGPVAVLVALGAAVALLRHCARRFGGVSGDVLGFGIEVATTVALVLMSAQWGG